MKNLRHGKYLVALLALVLVFAACRGESPTAPPLDSGPGIPPSGAPPTDAVITLTVANPNPQAGSNTLISARVTVNNNNVPDGTAVEFSTTAGVFQEPDPDSAIAIRTTTGGVATVTLTSSAAVTATVRAVVNNVAQTTTVTFVGRPVDPPAPTPTSPSITSVTPVIAPPTGGTVVTIRGTNFRPPVKVFFDFGNGQVREAVVISQTAIAIQVFTPQVDLGSGQTATASIIVFFEQGTPAETSITFGTPFTFQRAILTPILRAVSPASGGIDGGTRVTLFGEGFEHPVQVFFGAAETQVVNVTFSQIIVIAPPARDTADNGSGTVTGPVDIRVININSGEAGSLSGGFRYTPKMQITAAGPTTGSSLGGTRVTIDGTGFDQPVAVQIGGIAAQPVFVSGTQIIAVTLPTASPCGASSGAISVINIDNGDSATGPVFTFIGVDPVITGITSAGAITPGSTITVSVSNPGIGPLGSAVIRFDVGDATVIPSPSVITNGTGTQPFTVVIPSTGFAFPTVACTTGTGAAGTQLGPLNVDIEFNNVTTGCTDAITGGLRVVAPGANPCLTPPSPSVSANPSNVAGCAAPPNASVTVAPQTTTATITVSNAANAQPLNVTNITISGTNATEFSVAPTTASNIPAGGSATFTLTFDPTTAGAKVANVNVITNAPTQPPPLCVQTTALP